MIRCSTCRETKPPESFNRNRSSRTGRQAWCRPCHNAVVLQWARDNPDLHYAKQRRSDLKRRYGITVKQYDAMLDGQGGACAVCGKAPTNVSPLGRGIPLVVDHDHATGAIRGLLCHQCNRAIGFLGDTLESLRRALTYVSTPNF